MKQDKIFYYDEVSKKLKSHLEGKLCSAYSMYMQAGGRKADKTTGFPEYTTYTTEKPKTIDHIMFTPNDFEVVSLLEMPKKYDVRDGLPNKAFPSDHLRIETVLAFK